MGSYFRLLLITGWFLVTTLSALATEDVIAEFVGSTFQEIRELDKLPIEIKGYLEKRINNGIAPIGGKFEATDVILDSTLPKRRLKLAGFKNNIWFVWYEHGGRALHHHLAIFNFSHGKLELLYTARTWAKDLNDLKQKLASGTVEDETLVANKHGYW